MEIQSSYRVFFAFPFDSAIKPMYERIMTDLKTRCKERFQFLFGNSSVIEPSPKFLKYQMFKEQNTDLLNQFLSNIKSCDVVVADLTYNNLMSTLNSVSLYLLIKIFFEFQAGA